MTPIAAPLLFVVVPFVSKTHRSRAVDATRSTPNNYELEVPIGRGERYVETKDETELSLERLSPPALRYSDADWFPVIMSTHQSKILARIKGHLIANVFIASCVAMARVIFFPEASVAAGSTVTHSLLGGAMSLLLVFRTNAAYDRWWEARKAWGRVLATSREIGRCAGFLELRSRLELASSVCAFPELLRLRVTNRPRAFHTELARRACESAGMRPQVVRRVVDARHRPLECVRVMGEAVRQGFSLHHHNSSSSPSIDRYQRAVEREMLERQVSNLNDCLGICERILNAPIPLSYSRHTSRFVTLWLATLPFVLQAPPIILPFVAAVASWALLAIQEIGHSIEEPFNNPFESTPECPTTSLAMDLIAKTVRDELAWAVPELAARRSGGGGGSGDGHQLPTSHTNEETTTDLVVPASR